MHRAAVGEGKYAEKDSADNSVYTYNTQARADNDHDEREIQQAVEERKIQMKILLDIVKAKAIGVEAKMKEQTELMEKSEGEIVYAEKEITETVKEGIRLLNEHEAAMKANLAKIRERQRRTHRAKMERFEKFASLLRMCLENGEGIVQQGSGSETLEVEHISRRCEELLDAEEIQIYKPKHVRYVARRSVLASQVVATQVDSSQSEAKGKDLRDRGVHEFEFELSSG